MNMISKSVLSVAILLFMFFVSFLTASQNDYENFCKDQDCILEIIEENRNFLLCEYSDNRSSCYERISRIYNESKLCQYAVNQSECLYNFAIFSLDFNYCLSIGSLSDNCIFDVAIRLENSSLCKMTKNINYCFYSYAIWSNDTQLCNQSENYKNACLNRLLRTN